METLDSPALKPVYWQTKPNQTIELPPTLVEFDGGSHSGETCEARPQMKFGSSPDLRVNFEWSSVDNSPSRWLPSFDGEFQLFIVNSKVRLPAFTIRTHHQSCSKSMTVAMRRTPSQVYASSASIRSATFHLFNWPNFRGTDDYHLSKDGGRQWGWTRLGQLYLRSEDWVVRVSAMPDTEALCDALREEGGFVNTHVGEVRASKDGNFTTESLDDLLHSLHYFFGFALGQWRGPALTTGVDATGERAFEEWGFLPYTPNRWNAGYSVFSERRADFLGDLWPGFRLLLESPVWEKAIRDAVYWYVAANAVGNGVNCDSAILFSQAALELLAWTHCVKSLRVFPEHKFGARGMSAANKLRELARSLEIPLDIPEGMRALRAKRGKPWSDSMDAITDVRNKLVHPGSGDTLPDGAYYEAWNLSMWYVERVILRLCRFDGKCADRTKTGFVGDTWPVPWSE